MGKEGEKETKVVRDSEMEDKEWSVRDKEMRKPRETRSKSRKKWDKNWWLLKQKKENEVIVNEYVAEGRVIKENGK